MTQQQGSEITVGQVARAMMLDMLPALFDLPPRDENDIESFKEQYSVCAGSVFFGLQLAIMHPDIAKAVFEEIIAEVGPDEEFDRAVDVIAAGAELIMRTK